MFYIMKSFSFAFPVGGHMARRGNCAKRGTYVFVCVADSLFLFFLLVLNEFEKWRIDVIS